MGIRPSGIIILRLTVFDFFYYFLAVSFRYMFTFTGNVFCTVTDNIIGIINIVTVIIVPKLFIPLFGTNISILCPPGYIRCLVQYLNILLSLFCFDLLQCTHLLP